MTLRYKFTHTLPGHWKEVTTYSIETQNVLVCNGGEDYRFGFNGLEKDNEVKDKGNSLDFGARIYDSRLGRFASVDRFSNKFPSQSSYLFAGNTPLAGVDVNGDSLYVLTYTNSYTAKGYREGNELFQAAALTRKYDIEHSPSFDPKRDVVVLLNVNNMGEIAKKVDDVVKSYSPVYGKTAEFSIWSHAGYDGPSGSELVHNGDAIDGKQVGMKTWGSVNFNWESGSRANFYGCNTGSLRDGVSFTTRISALTNFKDVKVGGIIGTAYPSRYTDSRVNNQNGIDEKTGEDNWINSESNGILNSQKVYMSGFDGIMHNTYKPMRISENGVGSVSPENIQPGDKTP